MAHAWAGYEGRVSDSTLSFDDRTSLEGRTTGQRLALALTWCADDPSRVGEVLVMPHKRGAAKLTLGRGEDEGDLALRAELLRQRPGRNYRCDPLSDRRISRDQWVISTETATALRVENIGRCPMTHNGEVCQTARVELGDTIGLRKALQFVCISRPPALPVLPGLGPLPAFGEPDAHGLVGESELAWALRAQAVFAGARRPHVLILGPSGSGKERVAQAVHATSVRAELPMVSRNAATIPDGLAAAELFGNVRDYPNPGMQDRRGLFGEAHRSTLFLDELGEIPPAIQANLLRALDSGEVHRLGDARPQHLDVRVIGATNRGIEALKHDVLARFKLRIEVPDLNTRREDVPLLARHLVRAIGADDDEVRSRFFDGEMPRLSARLTRALVQRAYTANVRELEVLLWQSIGTSQGDQLEYTPEVAEAVVTADDSGSSPATPTVRDQDLDPAQIQAVLDANGGRLKDTWQALGLKNRFQLIRLIKKHGLTRSS